MIRPAPHMDHLDHLPCPVLITDGIGRVLVVNSELLELVGATAAHWRQKTIEDLIPPASRIFLHTYVWPMLMRDDAVREIQLQICDAQGRRIPVMVNSRKGHLDGEPCYYWIFFVALERSRFEAEVLAARNLAQASSLALAESERFIKTITDGLPGLVAYWDRALRCRFANRPYLEWFGQPLEAVIESNLKTLLGERLFALNKPYVLGALSGQAQQFERTLTKADGSADYTLVNYIPDLDDEGAVLGFFVLISDVTSIKTSEVELKLAASVFSSTIEGIMVTDAHGIILSVNPAFTQITGYTATEAIGQPQRFLEAPPHDPGFFAALWADAAAHGRGEGEVWNRHKNGDVFMTRQSITLIRGVDDEPLRYVSVFRDITKRWQQDEHTRHLALHDGLTDLPNRHLLMERFNQLITLGEREPRQLAVLFLDLDGFKRVNDTLGHDIGDEVLKLVAGKLQALVRKSDTVARVGGDEFVILLDNPVGQDEVAHVASRIIEMLNEPMEIRDQVARIGTSVGIAMHPADGASAAQLITHADTAMYAAKGAGKNTYRFFAAIPRPPGH